MDLINASLPEQRYGMTWTRCLLWSMPLVAAMFVTVLAFFPARFETSDDFMSCLGVAGVGFAIEPDEHLLYSHVWVGLLLKWLYENAPHFPWYGAYQYVLQYLAHCALAYCALRSEQPRLALGLYLFYFASVGVSFLWNLQFTSTAALVGQAGIVLLTVQLLSLPDGTRRRLTEIVLGMCLLILSSMVRWHGFLMALSQGVPLLIGLFLCRLASRQDATRLLLVLALTMATCCGFKSYNDIYHMAKPDWRDFLELKTLMPKITDTYPISFNSANSQVFNHVGWSETDLSMIRDAEAFDPRTFSPQKLRYVIDHAEKPGQGFQLLQEFQALRAHCLTWPIVACWAATALLLVAHRRALRDWRVVLGGASLSFLIVGLVWVLFRKVPPRRVVDPLLTFPLLFALSMVGGPAIRRTSWRRWSFGFSWFEGALLAISIACLHEYWYQSRLWLHTQDVVRAELDDVVRKRDCILAWCGEDCGLYLLSSPTDSLDHLKKIRMASLTWCAQGPAARQALQSWGITDLTRAICDDERVMVVGWSFRLPQLQRFLQEHTGNRIKLYSVYSGQLLNVVKARSVKIVGEEASNVSPAGREK